MFAIMTLIVVAFNSLVRSHHLQVYGDKLSIFTLLLNGGAVTMSWLLIRAFFLEYFNQNYSTDFIIHNKTVLVIAISPAAESFI